MSLDCTRGKDNKSLEHSGQIWPELAVDVSVHNLPFDAGRVLNSMLDGFRAFPKKWPCLHLPILYRGDIDESP